MTRTPQCKKTWLLLLFFFCASAAIAQTTIRGTVRQAEDQRPLAGATVTEKGTNNAVLTDEDGSFTINVSRVPAALVITHVGFTTQELSASGTEPVTISLVSGGALTGVTIVGTRFFNRTEITSPLPIDNISVRELRATGQLTFDRMLNYTVPSFNSAQQTISDATAHFDPFDLRGLGPSRTLVLINGKRKNPSSLVYINDVPGKGEVGVDMKSIPPAAIARVEVLRDGASAQYGSDAIAGVVNVILKENVDDIDVNLFSGVTSQGDGFQVGFNGNLGFKLGQNGFFNMSTSYLNQNETNRANNPGKDDLFGIPANDPTWGAWLREFPNLGMRVGQPNMTIADVFFNSGVKVGGNNEIYGFGGITTRKGKSYALYRAPYWIPSDFGLLTPAGQTYKGFQPTFETDILDNTFTTGVRGERNNWRYDLSHSFGSNTVDYTVSNSINLALGAQSPVRFKTGGYEFRHNVINFDLGRKFNRLTYFLGTEFRRENFVANAGQEESYAGNGVQSFPGIQPSNEVDEYRNNVGVYTGLDFDITDDFLLGGAVRYENYSDFGDNVTWKLNGRYKFANNRVTLRSSVSTGFRAPSLHQRYLSIIQTLVSGGTVSNQGTFNNENPAIRRLQVPRLKEENSVNFTAGIAARPLANLSVSVDYYRIKVNDRVVYSSSISTNNQNTEVYQILQQFQITSLKFFINAANTVTQGVDLVANYRNLKMGRGNFNINFAANFNKNELEGTIGSTPPIQQAGINIFDRKEQSRILTARPNNKIVLGLDYNLGRFGATLNNTRFGEVTWQHEADARKDQTFSAKTITDLNLVYRFSNRFSIGVAVNNLFDVYPDPIDNKGDVVTDLGGRFRYPWEVNQFGFNGTTFTGNINIKF